MYHVNGAVNSFLLFSMIPCLDGYVGRFSVLFSGLVLFVLFFVRTAWVARFSNQGGWVDEAMLDLGILNTSARQQAAGGYAMLALYLSKALLMRLVARGVFTFVYAHCELVVVRNSALGWLEVRREFCCREARHTTSTSSSTSKYPSTNQNLEAEMILARTAQKQRRSREEQLGRSSLGRSSSFSPLATTKVAIENLRAGFTVRYEREEDRYERDVVLHKVDMAAAFEVMRTGELPSAIRASLPADSFGEREAPSSRVVPV